MNIEIKNNAELWGAIYLKLQQIDENKKRRRRRPKQLDLEEWIHEYEEKVNHVKNS